VTDVRSLHPDATRHRRARFEIGWRNAVDGQVYTDDTLVRLTWQNLGWRLGAIFGSTSDSLMREMYGWCVRQQDESALAIADD
jgi:hypothetical protein